MGYRGIVDNMENNIKQEDRISKYLSMLNRGMLFDELSEKYLRSADVYDILKGVPIPVSVDENGDMTTLTVALNMALVIGADRNYPYAEQYLEYIKRITQGHGVEIMLSEGARAADNDAFEIACMYFRAALMLEPQSRDALYLYGRACHGAYEQEGMDEEYVGNFKAESLEAFELLTVMHQDFAMGYYFLGYAYLNLGLYTKAQLTWKDFIKLSTDESEADIREEISERLNQLEEPVIIEQACNQIMSGDFQGGKQKLEPFKSGRYENWWPMWHYLSVAETGLGNVDEAIADVKKALSLSPSNIELMESLISLYTAVGDEDNAEKYRKKIQIVQSNIEADSILK